MSTEYVTIIILIMLMILSACFSASETAYTSLNPIKLKNMVLEGNKKAEKALANHQVYDKILTTILIGNNIVNTAAATICTALFVSLFAEMGTLYATLFMITLLLIVGEITPKTMAKRNPEKFSIIFATFLQVSTTIMAPIVWAFLKLSNLISRGVQKETTDNSTLTEEELFVMIDEIEEKGTLHKRESELIKSAIEFDDIRVSEIYTSRVDLVAADVHSDIESMKELFIETEYSRIPVYEENIDRIVGAIYSKDFFSRYVKDRDFKLANIIRPVKFVPENTSIATLLADLQKSKIHMAVVLDNFGGTMGIVSLEDILEELVGDIWDENDEVQYPMVKEGDGTYTILGEANIFDIMDELEIRFKDDEYDSHSVSGFICHKLEKIPKKGDSVETDDFTIVVKEMKSRRIKEATLILKTENPQCEE